ncbi:hypothetical protein HDZ31DRAFT_69160 [Schizophyllum fasciatum]
MSAEPDEIYELSDEEHGVVVRTIVGGQAILEQHLPDDALAKAEEEARQYQALAKTRLDRLITANKKLSALQKEAATQAAQLAALRSTLQDRQNHAREEALLSIASVGDTLDCSICLDVMNDPVVLNPCGHSACASCVLRWMYNQKALGQRPTCTSCRTPMATRPIRNTSARKACDAVTTLYNPQRTQERLQSRQSAFEDGSAWDGFRFTRSR